MLTRSCKRRPTQTHPPSSYKTNFPCQLPPESTITFTRTVLALSLPLIQQIQRLTHTFPAHLMELNSAVGIFSRSARSSGKVLSQLKSICIKHPLSPEDTCTHKQTASHINTCCHFANCFDVRYCVLTVTLHRNCTTAVSNTVISKMRKV